MSKRPQILFSELSNSPAPMFGSLVRTRRIPISKLLLAPPIARRARSINLVTRNPLGKTSQNVRTHPRGRVHPVPVSDQKDGFLATHSLVGTIGILLHAFDSLSR